MLKYNFHYKRVKFLGFIVLDKGIKIDPKKIKNIIK